MDAFGVIERFFAALNGADWSAALDLLAEDVVLDFSPAERQIGREQFHWWIGERRRQGRETFRDIAIMASGDGSRAAAEFTLQHEGSGGERNSVNAGMFFALSGGRIERITCCNIP